MRTKRDRAKRRTDMAMLQCEREKSRKAIKWTVYKRRTESSSNENKKTAHKLFNCLNLQFYYTVGRLVGRSVEIKVKAEKANRKERRKTQQAYKLKTLNI